MPGMQSMVLAAARRAVLERGPIRVVKRDPEQKGSRRGAGLQQEGTAESFGEHEGLGCTQPHGW